MLVTPFGNVEITIDSKPYDYVAIKLPIGGKAYSGVTARYAIPISFNPDGAEHEINCRLCNVPEGVDCSSDPGEDIESVQFDTKDRDIYLHIACRGETWEMGCTTESAERGFDYDTLTMHNGMQYVVMPTTKTTQYYFGIAWKSPLRDWQDADEGFAADPNYYEDYYCLNPDIGTITYDILLALFKSGRFVDETRFFFNDDPKEVEHYLGYLPEFEDAPYWVGYCDVEDGCEYKTAEELFEAKIFDGQSIKDRWDTVVLLDIGGISVEDYYYSVPEVRYLFTEGSGSIKDVYDVTLKNLNEHDVYGLLDSGAPSDEYKSEASKIASDISKAV